MIEALILTLLIAACLLAHCRAISRERERLLGRIQKIEEELKSAPIEAANKKVDQFMASVSKFSHESIFSSAAIKRRTIKNFSAITGESIIRRFVEDETVLTEEYDAQQRLLLRSHLLGSGITLKKKFNYASDGRKSEDIEYDSDGTVHKRFMRTFSECGKIQAIKQFNCNGEHTHTSEFNYDKFNRKVRETIYWQYGFDHRIRHSDAIHISKAHHIPSDQFFIPKPEFWVYHYSNEDAKEPYLEEGFRGDGTLESSTLFRYDENGRLRCSEGRHCKRYLFYQGDATDPCMAIQLDSRLGISVNITQYEYCNEDK